MPEYYQLEERIPASSLVAWRHWATLFFDGGCQCRFDDQAEAVALFYRLHQQGRAVRVVRVTEEVVVTGEFREATPCG